MLNEPESPKGEEVTISYSDKVKARYQNSLGGKHVVNNSINSLQIEKESNSEIELSEKDEWEKLLTWVYSNAESENKKI